MGLGSVVAAFPHVVKLILFQKIYIYGTPGCPSRAFLTFLNSEYRKYNES